MTKKAKNEDKRAKGRNTQRPVKRDKGENGKNEKEHETKKATTNTKSNKAACDKKRMNWNGQKRSEAWGKTNKEERSETEQA